MCRLRLLSKKEGLWSRAAPPMQNFPAPHCRPFGVCFHSFSDPPNPMVRKLIATFVFRLGMFEALWTRQDMDSLGLRQPCSTISSSLYACKHS